MEENKLLEITSEVDEEDQEPTKEAGTTATPSSLTPGAPAHSVDGKAPITEDPYDFEQCTVTFTFTLLPADGDARGRRVVISARNHLDAPIFAEGEWRLADLVGEQAMPNVSVELAQRIVAALPARAQARQAKQAAQMPAAKSTGKAARGKHSQPTAPGQALLPNTVPGPTPAATSTAEEQPRAVRKEPHGAEKAVQLSMFDVFANDPEISHDPGNT